MATTTKMGATTTLLLVLATTATLFFDLAAARCKVMMFMPGHLDSHETRFAMKGLVRQGAKGVDDSKIEVVYMTKTGAPGNDGIAVFGKGVKWPTAAFDLDAASRRNENKKDDPIKGYYLAHHTTTGATNLNGASWTPGATVKLDLRGKLSPPEVEWLLIMEYDKNTDATALSVYVNQAPSFRAGVTRYQNYNGQGKLGFDLPSSQQFSFNIVSFRDGDVGSSRLFAGTGNYENAVVELEAFYAIAGNVKGDSTATVDGENYIYLPDGFAAGGGNANKDLKAAVTAHNIDLKTKKLDCSSISFVVAFSMTHKKVIFYQKMMMVNDGYYNGKLTSATGLTGGASFAGNVVFGGRKEASFKIYNIVVANVGSYTNAHAFYGMGDWATEGKAALAAATTAADDSNASPKYYYTGTNLLLANADVKTVTLDAGHTLGQVKWVAVLDITSSTGTIVAHRDMTKM